MSPALALCHADSVPYQPTPHPVALIIWLDYYHGKREGSRDLVIDRRGLVHGIAANNALAELCHPQHFWSWSYRRQRRRHCFGQCCRIAAKNLKVTQA